MIPDEASDVQLLNRASGGEEDAFVALYRRWQGNIYRFALRLGNSASMAEDVTQEVFLALIRGASRFDPSLGSFSSYLYGIARNHVLRRTTRERILTSIADNGDDEGSGWHEAYRISPDPLGGLAQAEVVESLHAAIATLPLRYREVVVMCELQEMKYAEAARVIGCSEGTVRSRLHRGRMLLLKKLHEKVRADSCAQGIEAARCPL